MKVGSEVARLGNSSGWRPCHRRATSWVENRTGCGLYQPGH